MTRLTALAATTSTALRALLVLAFLLVSGLAHAVPSACTAMWANSGTNLNYFNSANNTWVTAAVSPASGNALSGYEGDGSLYFVSGVAVPQTMYKATFSNTAGSITFSQMAGGTNVQVPASFTYTQTNGVTTTAAVQYIVGATLDRDTASKRMFLLGTRDAVTTIPINGTNTTTGPIASLGLLDPEAPGAVSWSVIYQTSATGTITYPLINTSGDIFADQQTGAVWYVTNTTPIRFYKLQLNYSGYTLNSVQVVQTATASLSTPSFTIGSVAVDPSSGLVYIGGAGALNNLPYRITDHTASPSVVGTLVQNGTGVNDSGNCVAPPDPPTITKSFNPTTMTTPGVATMTIVIKNPNEVPIFTTAALVDPLPTNMSVYTTPSITVSCFSSDGTVSPARPTTTTMTAVVGSGSVAISAGALIPGGSSSGGSCSFSVQVSATIAAFYNNTIAAGNLKTTAGNNAAQATATFQVKSASLPNAPVVTKSFSPTTASATVGTTTLTIVINNPNTSTDTLSAALVDTLPAGLGITTPSLISISCFSNGSASTKPSATTATTTTTALTIANGSQIPGGTSGGSCSFSVRITATTAGLFLNTIAAGSLTTAGGSNAAAATASFYLRASDFSVAKSQREGATGATTTAVLDVPSLVTISYVISIRNTNGLAGTRTFSDTLPSYITPVISVTPAAIGGAGCSTVTSTVGSITTVGGTVTGAAALAGCDITIVAKVSTTVAITTLTNSVGIYTVTNSAFDASTSNNTSTVIMVVKPAANLTITKTDGVTVLLTGSTNAYTITVSNLGPAGADGAVLKDPAATGLDCTTITCSASGGASCPLPAQLFVSALQSGTGLGIPTFPASSSVTFVLSCSVTATGQ